MEKNMFKLSRATVISTKANLKWIKVNKEKTDILENNGLSMDAIKVVARYIGSCGHDNKRHCNYCGEIYSKKMSGMDRYYHYKCPKDPKVIKEEEEENKRKEEEYKEYSLKRAQKQLDREMAKMIQDKKNDDKLFINNLIKNLINNIIN